MSNSRVRRVTNKRQCSHPHMATENPGSFDDIVPLLPFERILLGGIQATYHSLLEEASQTLHTDLTILEDAGEA
jgi:hypothetical protein